MEGFNASRIATLISSIILGEPSELLASLEYEILVTSASKTSLLEGLWAGHTGH